MRLRDYPDEHVLTEEDCYDGPNPPHPFPHGVKTRAVWHETAANNGLHAFLLVKSKPVNFLVATRSALCGATIPQGASASTSLFSAGHSALCLKCDKMLREDTFTTEERKAANYAYGEPEYGACVMEPDEDRHPHNGAQRSYCKFCHKGTAQVVCPARADACFRCGYIGQMPHQCNCSRCGGIVGGGRDGERCECFIKDGTAVKGVANRRWVGKPAGLAKAEIARAVELYKTSPRRERASCSGFTDCYKGWKNATGGDGTPCKTCNPDGEDPVVCPECGVIAGSCNGYGWACPRQGEGCSQRPWGRD